MVSCSTCTQIGTDAAYPIFTAHTQTHGQAAKEVMNCAGDREETASSSNHVDDGLQKFVFGRAVSHTNLFTRFIHEVCWSTVAMPGAKNALQDRRSSLAQENHIANYAKGGIASAGEKELALDTTHERKTDHVSRGTNTHSENTVTGVYARGVASKPLKKRRQTSPGRPWKSNATKWEHLAVERCQEQLCPLLLHQLQYVLQSSFQVFHKNTCNTGFKLFT